MMEKSTYKVRLQKSTTWSIIRPTNWKGKKLEDRRGSKTCAPSIPSENLAGKTAFSNRMSAGQQRYTYDFCRNVREERTLDEGLHLFPDPVS